MIFRFLSLHVNMQCFLSPQSCEDGFHQKEIHSGYVGQHVDSDDEKKSEQEQEKQEEQEKEAEQEENYGVEREEEPQYQDEEEDEEYPECPSLEIREIDEEKSVDLTESFRPLSQETRNLTASELLLNKSVQHKLTNFFLFGDQQAANPSFCSVFSLLLFTSMFDNDEISESDKFFVTLPRPVKLMFALYNTMVSKSEMLCYFVIILNHIVSASFLSLILPILIFLWAMLSVPRPSKRFWMTAIIYTEV